MTERGNAEVQEALADAEEVRQELAAEHAENQRARAGGCVTLPIGLLALLLLLIVAL